MIQPITVQPKKKLSAATPSAEGAWRTTATMVGSHYIANRVSKKVITVQNSERQRAIIAGFQAHRRGYFHSLALPRNSSPIASPRFG
jgi:hypothetical protein